MGRLSAAPFLEKQMLKSITLNLVLGSLLAGCAAPDEDASSSTDSDTSEPTGSDDDYLTLDGIDDSMCSDAYSVCGDLLIPADLEGTARSLVVVLYSEIPPAGPPEGFVVQVEYPDIRPGYRYPIREGSILYDGPYYLWANLYMEGGGEWTPVNGIDFTGNSAQPVTLGGDALQFDDITLQIASGW